MKTTSTRADYQSEIKGGETTRDAGVALDAQPHAPPRSPYFSLPPSYYDQKKQAEYIETVGVRTQ